MATLSEDVMQQRQNDDSEGEEEATIDYPAFPAVVPGVPALDPFSIPTRPQDVPAYVALASRSHRSSSSALPKRGLKDFEPHPTQLQASTLETSRQSMYDALTHLRLHQPKTRVIGIFDETTGLTKVEKRKGNWLGNVGRDIAGGGVELRREEALWALERGSLDCRFRLNANTRALNQDSVKTAASSSSPRRSIEDADGGDQNSKEELGLPMSLQASYATLINSDSNAIGGRLTMEEYIVYAGLKRSGFIVLRPKGPNQWKSQHSSKATHEEQALPGNGSQRSLLEWLRHIYFSRSREVEADKTRLQKGPLVKIGLYRTYHDIFRTMNAQIPSSVAPVSANGATQGYQRKSTYSSTWHVYKPRQTRPFKKSDPGPPDFTISVVSARTTKLPTLAELESLLNEQPIDPPRKESGTGTGGRGIGQTYAALKHGHRNVLLAIVDEGLVSYLRIADAMFSLEGRLFDHGGFGGVGGANRKKGGGGRRKLKNK
ncbi:MAG: hypothetical protein Q9162_004576 [Coniocarpon cinnabarinum]